MHIKFNTLQSTKVKPKPVAVVKKSTERTEENKKFNLCINIA